MNQWRLLCAALGVLVSGCFHPSEVEPLAEGTDTDGGGEPASSSTAAGEEASASQTSAAPSTGATQGDDTSEDESSGVPADCADGERCLEIPMGWDGPFVALPEGIEQCGDGGSPSHVVGAAPEYDAACTCDCEEATAQSCVTELLVGGAPGTCGDNDEVLDVCTNPMPTGAVTCDGGANCFAPTEAVMVDSYRSCGSGVGGVVHPVFGEAVGFCEAEQSLGAPCADGQCAAESAAVCITAAGHRDVCPDDFPVRSLGHEGFEVEDVTCECECRDPEDCSYQTWYDAASCGAGGGDDDPVCSQAAGRLAVLSYSSLGTGCAPVEEVPADPPPPVPSDAITMCCTR
jgi:hypothetical protein